MSAPSLALDLDAVLGDTGRLWDDWVASADATVGTAALPADRVAAAAELDARAGNWRTLLERYAADRAPVYLRRDAAVSAALRALHASGARLAVFTDAPEELARVALTQLGAERRVESLHTGEGAEARARAALGEGAAAVRTRTELLALV